MSGFCAPLLYIRVGSPIRPTPRTARATSRRCAQPSRAPQPSRHREHFDYEADHTLYDAEALGRGDAPVAALASYEDIYVERAFSEATAALLGERAQLWVTNEFQHSGLRDEPATVFDRLLAMSKGELAIPS